MKVQIINHLGSSDAEVQKIAEVAQLFAVMVCADHELAPCEVEFIAGAPVPRVGWLAMGLFLNPDVSGALGYHDLDPRGLPYGKAFLSVVPGQVMLHDPSGHGASLAGVVMHELAEMLGDRFANLWAFGLVHDPRHPKRKFGALAYELADPVQDAAFQMKSKDGTDVDCSDYVLPAFFNPDTPATQMTSRTGAAVGPMACAPGGYLIVAQEHGETQVFGRKIGAHHERVLHDEVDPPAWREEIRALPGSRSSRRARVA